MVILSESSAKRSAWKHNGMLMWTIQLFALMSFLMDSLLVPV